ncbi:Six-bladed beta-propeller, TolB-like [Moorella glycerini]|uniref:Protein TolB n=1 Tax=Neomoorella stamsii TaxID=1266720 RepID=A0A9X7J3U7_9FIRM|nr:Protein TolB [Moorella stamsii]CEP69098.1 Six-bladed beta-propeller, TolB-like [Moorella glycerini]
MPGSTMHYAKEPFKSLVLLALFFLLAGLIPATALAETEGIAIFVDGQELNLEEPAVIQDGYLLAPVRNLAAALQARVAWSDESRTVLITTPETTIVLKVGSKEALKNGEKLSLPVPVQIINDRSIAPLRFLAGALGAAVAWDEQNLTATITTPPAPVPERAYSGAFPARVAFTANGILYLLDGSRAGAKPVRVTKEGTVVTILGWSPDGQWLAYLQREKQEEWAAKPYLWVVKADGSGAFQVDPRPVLGQPAWSPCENTLAYSTGGPGGGYAPDMNLKLATIKDGRVQVIALLPDRSELVQDFAWAPDGQSLALSLPRNEDQPLRIDRLATSKAVTLNWKLTGTAWCCCQKKAPLA